ncbi:helix-turn-helix domain-containing protein [Cohnella fermenti]|uniref:Helix-turn-helix domain-containing protein n=1 Tax=Cohnella fermenti TaxID=2565925 RepID=A0A4S4BEW6_9BACL|nr:helix-turn-helix domain-containing protein [Cohnella fermenti]THF72636.1 helix-turn-helix domain-containing protein [Cohnella fermenti]
MNVFRRFIRQRQIASILLLSIIPTLGFGAILYNSGVRMIKSEVNRTSEVAISQVKDKVDQLTLQIEEITGQFAMQSNTVEFVNLTAAPPLGAMMFANDLRNDLTYLANSIEALDSVYLYNETQQVVVTSEQQIADWRDFTDIGWMERAEEMIAHNRMTAWIVPRTIQDRAGNARTVITYIRILPIFYTQAKAVLVVNLDPGAITKVIRSFPFDTTGALLVFSPTGELIRQSGTPQADIVDELQRRIADGYQEFGARTSLLHSQYVTMDRSGRNGWTYAVLVPSAKPAGSVLMLKRIIVTTTVLLSLLSLVMAYFNYSRFQRGVVHILRLLSMGRPESKERDGALPEAALQDNLRRIEHRVSHLLEEMDEVEAKWREQLPVLRDHFLLSSLLGNGVKVEQWMVERSADAPLFEHPSFCAIVIEKDSAAAGDRFGGKDKKLFLFAVSNIAQELLKGILQAETLVTRDNVVVILNLPEPIDERNVREGADRIRQAVSAFLKQSITIAVGKTVRGLDHLNASYEEAVRTLHMNWLQSGDRVLMPSDGGSFAERTVLYPVQWEDELLEGIRSGNLTRAETSLTQFLEELHRSRAGVPQIRTYCLQLLVSVVRLLQEYDPNLTHVYPDGNPYDEFIRLNSPESLYDWFIDRTIRPALAYLNSLREHRLDEVVGRMLKVIERDYGDDLSLQKIGDELRLSPSYLSELFKERTGENFIAFVTKYRIERTKELLVRTDLTLADIADEVGYRTAPQLIRVFKKLEGRTPGDYRLEHAAPC